MQHLITSSKKKVIREEIDQTTIKNVNKTKAIKSEQVRKASAKSCAIHPKDGT
jgi:DNA polymerase elongation subunit (family B)